MPNSSLQKSLKLEQINSCHELIDIVANRQLKDFGKINSDIKLDGTLITECDRWSDQEIVNGIESK